jgi:dolichyl-diphosphooligosaccharide--protein glycosyltransferase
VRSLFIPHTKTGNPLVDSVAEHQATGNAAYWVYFHITSWLAPAGFLLLFFPPITDAKVFGICYTLASAYFSRKMVRLVLLLSPSVCVTTGIVSGLFFDWAVMQLPYIRDFLTAASSSSSSTDSASTKNKKNKKSGSKSKSATASFLTTIKAQLERVKCVYPLVAVAILVGLVFLGFSFYQHSAMLAEHLSEPQIILRGTHEGKEVIIDDFREAYWWLRDNTPEDARVMAWWDYGYQINGIANRTSIADGNTWNHEHIALLGRTLVSNETESHKLARHLADYVLVWTTRLVGMQSDDIAKMPHMVRIAGSVYPDIKPNDYWLDQNSGGSPAMTESILYRMTFYRILPHVQPFKLFEEVYMTRNRMVRIYKVLKVAKRSPPRTYAKQLPVRKTFKHMRDPL